jgi:hypothetical protein
VSEEPDEGSLGVGLSPGPLDGGGSEGESDVGSDGGAAELDEPDPDGSFADEDGTAGLDPLDELGVGVGLGFGFGAPRGVPGSTGGSGGLCFGGPLGAVGTTGTVMPTCVAYTRSRPMTIDT